MSRDLEMMATYRWALVLFPLALYFFQLGRWNAGDRPKVVSGTADFWLLVFGLSGLIVFGSAGEFFVGLLFGKASPAAWIAVVSGLTLVAIAGSSRARNRLVVYHVTGQDLTRATGLALERIAGPVHQTLQGYEDREGLRGLRIEVGTRLGFGVVESYGQNPSSLIERIRPLLVTNLASVSTQASRLPTLWFGLSFMLMAVLCVATAYLTRIELRAFVHRIAGW